MMKPTLNLISKIEGGVATSNRAVTIYEIRQFI